MPQQRQQNASPEELKDAVERLTENEDIRLQLRSRIQELAEQHDADVINSLPILYRMKIKRVLEESGHQIAHKIEA